MNREGIVTEVKGDYVQVDLVRHSACGSCGACHMGDENMQMSVECLNQAQAQVGDRVELVMKTENVLAAAFIAYMIPLAMFILGLVVSMKVLTANNYQGSVEGIGTLIGLVAMFITYGIIRLNDDKFKSSQKYLSVVIKVLNEKDMFCF